MNMHKNSANESCLHCFWIAAATLIAISIPSPSSVWGATEAQMKFVEMNSEVLHLAAEDMRDEIKSHFSESKVYGKLLRTSSRIKCRSAAISRRVKRSDRYNGLERDLTKLDQLVHELDDLCQEAIEQSILCLDQPILGSTAHVVEKICHMIELTHCIMAVADSPTKVKEIPVLMPRLLPPADSFDSNSRYGSTYELYRPSVDIAPGLPLNAPTLQVDGADASELLEPAEKFGKSVLKK